MFAKLERQEQEFLRSKDCNDSSTAHACCKFFLWACCAKCRKHDKKGMDCKEKNFDALNGCACVAGHTAVPTL